MFEKTNHNTDPFPCLQLPSLSQARHYIYDLSFIPGMKGQSAQPRDKAQVRLSHGRSISEGHSLHLLPGRQTNKAGLTLPSHPWWPFPIKCHLWGCSVLLPFFSGPAEDGGRGRRVDTASLTRNPVQNISKDATALPGDLEEDLCPQSGSSRHKRMHSCSEK